MEDATGCEMRGAAAETADVAAAVRVEMTRAGEEEEEEAAAEEGASGSGVSRAARRAVAGQRGGACAAA